MFARAVVISAMLGTVAHAAVRSGKATAEWVAASAAYRPGAAVHTAIRLVADPGWHTYWINPGEGGMKTTIEIEAPAGWKAEPLGQPAPKRFTTSELPGFGYEGAVLFPVALTPPADAAGKVKAVAKVSWLTCNDSACVPGEAILELELDAGNPSPTPDAEAIAAAEKQVPAAAANVTLTVHETGDSLHLRLHVPAGNPLDPAACDVFPETAQAIDPKQEIRFAKAADGWTATVRKSEYAPGPLRELKLVLAGKGAPRPLEVTWKSPEP